MKKMMEGTNKLLLNLIIVGVVFPHFVMGQITVRPSNVTVPLGGNVTLICQVESGVYTEWLEYITSSTGKKIFTSEAGIIGDQNKYDFEGTYNLIIKDLAFTDGGYYGCIAGSMTEPVRADVVVMEQPEAITGDLIENEMSVVTCNVKYQSALHGSMNPSQIPKLEGYIEGMEPFIDYVTTRTPDYYLATMEKNYTGMVGDNGQNLVCRAYTEDPAYEDSGTQTMDILFAVRDINFAPRNTEYYVGEYINCTAAGNPEPSYQWIAQSSPGPKPVGQSKLEIDPTMVGSNVWDCIATNNVKGTETIEDTIEFLVTEDGGVGGTGQPPTATAGWVIAIAVIIPLAIIIILIAVGVVFWKKRMSTSNDKPRSNPRFEEDTYENNENMQPGFTKVNPPQTKPPPQPQDHNGHPVHSPFYPAGKGGQPNPGKPPYQNQPPYIVGGQPQADLGLKNFGYPPSLNNSMDNGINRRPVVNPSPFGSKSSGLNQGYPGVNPNPYGSRSDGLNNSMEHANSRRPMVNPSPYGSQSSSLNQGYPGPGVNPNPHGSRSDGLNNTGYNRSGSSNNLANTSMGSETVI